MTLNLASVAGSDITQATKQLCRSSLQSSFDIKHLPTELRHQLESYERHMLSLLSQAQQLYLSKGATVADSIQQWSETAYYYGPQDILESDEWHNFYPAVLIEDRPYRDPSEAVEATELGQRYLTTQLLTGALTKKKQKRLEDIAQKLVCTLDPRDDAFFTQETLDTCLKQEKLDSDKAINALLGRKHYQPVTKADRRNALAKRWEERNQRLKLQYLFDRGQWDDFQEQVLRAFTYRALDAFVQSQQGHHKGELELAIWAVLKRADELGDLSAYYLDPREAETWEGLKALSDALTAEKADQLHNDTQSGGQAAQHWMKAVGLPLLYDDTVDWWAELPDLESERYSSKGLAVIGKLNRSPREDIELMRALFFESVRDCPYRDLIEKSYGLRVQEVMTCEE
jgi:hypothetical protein